MTTPVSVSPPIRMSIGRPDLQIPITAVEGVPGVYGCGVPFQLSATHAGLFCNLRGVRVPVIDFEVGTDVVVFDRLEGIRPENALTISRNEPGEDPKTVWVKYPVVGGFVPLGAKRADGSVHPHAGTGFGLLVAVTFPADHSVYHPSGVPGVRSRLELQQYRFDGGKFEVTESRAIAHDALLPGWRVSNHGLTSAVPDGQDLLLGMVAARSTTKGGDLPADPTSAPEGDQCNCAGVSRWRHGDHGWIPVTFQPVAGAEGTCEPSLIRCPDGSLAMAARGTGASAQRLLVWHCPVGADRWRQTVHVERGRSATPVSLNCTPDGTAYLAFNPWREPLQLPDGRELPSGEMRQSLSLHPLDVASGALGEPVNAFDCEPMFGPSPGGSLWRVDHPISAVVRLADRRLHNLMGFRVCEKDEVDWDFPPTLQTGCWVEEVGSDRPGPDCPDWQF